MKLSCEIIMLTASAVSIQLYLHCTRNLAAAEAPSTNVNMARGPFHNSRYSPDVRFPCSVCASVGVAHSNTERNALIANFTLSHLLHLLACAYYVPINSFIILTDTSKKCKHKLFVLSFV